MPLLDTIDQSIQICVLLLVAIIFLNTSNMQKHSLKLHKQSISHPRDNCNETFPTKTALKKHSKKYDTPVTQPRGRPRKAIDELSERQTQQRTAAATQAMNELLSGISDSMQNKSLKKVLSENKNTPTKVNPVIAEEATVVQKNINMSDRGRIELLRFFRLKNIPVENKINDKFSVNSYTKHRIHGAYEYRCAWRIGIHRNRDTPAYCYS